MVCRDAHNLPSSTCDPRLLPADTKICEDSEPCPTLPTSTSTVLTTSTETEPMVPTVVSPTRENWTSSLNIDERKSDRDVSSPITVSVTDFDPDSDYLEGKAICLS